MTMTEVAQAAGVSLSTTSRYLRGQLRLSPTTAARIDDAVRELNYERPARTREADPTTALRIALVLPELGNPFFAQIADAVSLVVASTAASLYITVAGGEATREAVLTDLLDGAARFDGMIYVGMEPSNSAVTAAIRRGFPVVVLDEALTDTPEVDTVCADNFGGAYQATIYLLQLGHRSIAHIGGPSDLATSQERERGFRAAFEHAGVPVNESSILHGPYSEQFGANAFTQLIGATPTAVFVGSDIAAVGLLGAAARFGYRVPHDLSVVGCDGIRVGEWLQPQLSTLRQPLRELAELAVGTLTRRIKDSTTAPVSEQLPMTLTIRESSAAPAPTV
ncbi:LacI family DNA-binding transcriptional regulator [Curtobacterium sp. MWU13-2055]|uniref:LacI family DNA-binding transcriptional regulator n=1 Tax=Curtobacterium sp. MWU13-2055 TaxID=2931928 RepID=UPI00200C643D|nr:LacI family DNA-binding transcriptional regulator [Curtobacterium sp. MWU13-2055]